MNTSARTNDQLNDWYQQNIGYRPMVDDPRMTRAELLQLITEYCEASGTNFPS